MANEIKINVWFQCVNGSFKDTFDPGPVSVTQAAQGGGGPGVVSVGTSEEDLSFGDVGTLGYVCLRHIGTANFVTYGPKSGSDMVAFGRLKAGEIAVLRLEPGITWRWKADTAAVKVLVKMFDA